ncbi:vWA domain-containing protein [Paenibacillus sp. FSL R5-0701]|uniref:vWA domain-containing protein n=1 Tax=Paenibacillus sp. FSL R5-0701 TaxID=2921654 RepID=UPI0030D12B65
MDKEQVPQPQNGIEIPDTQSESNQTADKKTLRPNVSIRLLLSIATVLLIVGVIGLWYWNSDKTPFNIQVTIGSNEASTTETNKNTMVTAEEVHTVVGSSNVESKPAFIQVNQVDSSNYEKGEVDIYFSLFADAEFTNPIDSPSLIQDMFKVNGLPVSYVSQVNNIDTVSVDLVMDKSGSMMDPPNGSMNRSKMELVRNAAIEFLENVPDQAKGTFGLLTFSSFAPEIADIAFNSNRKQIVSYLSTLESDNGRTALYDSLTKALYDTNVQVGPKYIIAFTDGIDSQDSDYGSSSQSVIELSKQLGIPIYTIGFGDTSTELQWIAEETGGSYFSIHEEENLQLELQNIYENVFQKYVKQYKLTYRPDQNVSPGEEFPIALQMESPDYTAQTSTLEFIRKIETTAIQAMNGLFEYQVNYANAVNNLDFSLVSNNVNRDSDFYNNLKIRIEKDYVSSYNQGSPKIIDPLENYRTESIEQQADGSYKIEFFKLFPLELNQEKVFEADLNTYTVKEDPYSGKWQVSAFGRSECSIYKNESDPGSSCKNVNGTTKLYSQNPWTRN